MVSSELCNRGREGWCVAAALWHGRPVCGFAAEYGIAFRARVPELLRTDGGDQSTTLSGSFAILAAQRFIYSRFHSRLLAKGPPAPPLSCGATTTSSMRTVSRLSRWYDRHSMHAEAAFRPACRLRCSPGCLSNCRKSPLKRGRSAA